MYLEEYAKPYLDDCILGKCYLRKFKYWHITENMLYYV
jgi:hypothetical protein